MGVAEMLLTGQVDTEAFHRAVEDADDSDVGAMLAMVDHDNPAVRWAIAANLPSVGHGDPPSADMVAAGVRLSGDPDPKVRDWACMALGTQWREVDTDAVRDALAARLSDDHDDVRCEALVGLAYRRDARARDAVLAALSRESGSVWSLELEAAGALCDPKLHELVLDHLDGWDDTETADTADAARRLTDPDGIGNDVVEGVAELYRRRAHGLAEGDALTASQTMWRLLDIAPHRAVEFYDAVAARLKGDSAATYQLRERSSLAQLAADVR
ncbi:HEAT repeat domain-containing protein [Aquipuribacter hungaricus]|uniref:HEAT repeat domain-containing protein n=1 Tax=Aquipuribacter hungaricus TaxID=545624 RepID=A0ABV7WLF0_9MICO